MYDPSKCCPSLLELVKASITMKHYHKSVTKWIRGKVASLVPVIGFLLCIISFIRTRHSTIVQQLDSIIMWLCGRKKKVTQSFNYNVQFYKLVFGSLNRLGWCQSIDATRQRIDVLRQDFDSKVKRWRDKLSVKERGINHCECDIIFCM